MSDIDSIIAKMPKRVRDEVARLQARVATLEAQLKTRAEKPSRVRIHNYEDGGESLPDDTTIRFCNNATLGSDKYIEALWDRRRVSIRNDTKQELTQWLYLRCGFGQLLVQPHASNAVYVRAVDHDKNGEPKL